MGEILKNIPKQETCVSSTPSVALMPSNEEIAGAILSIINSNPDRFRGADGKDGVDGQSFNLEEFKKDFPKIIKNLYETNEEVRQLVYTEFIKKLKENEHRPRPTPSAPKKH
jgi:hypothetical protein